MQCMSGMTFTSLKTTILYGCSHTTHPSLTFPHLPFIHCQQAEIDHKGRAFLWSLPKREDFQPDNQLCTGMGRIYKHLTAPFHQFRDALIQQVETYAESIGIQHPLTDQDNQILNTLLIKTLPILNRLKCVSTGFRIVCQVFSALQRNLLKTEAFVDYLECQAHTVDRAEAASMTKTDHQNATLDGTTDRTDSIGTFIYSHDNLFHCKSLGINHWLIRPLLCPVHKTTLSRTLLGDALPMPLCRDFL